MKIADEIVAQIRQSKHVNNMQYGTGLNDEGMSELVAAKLRPIRDALHMVWDNPESMTPSDMLAQYTAACEMLEDKDV